MEGRRGESPLAISHLVSSHVCSVPLLSQPRLSLSGGRSRLTPSLQQPESHPMKCLVTGLLGANGRGDLGPLAQESTMRATMSALPRVRKRNQKNKTRDWSLYFPEGTVALS